MAIQLTSKLLPLTYQIDLQIGQILSQIIIHCRNLWDNLSNIEFYNFKNSGNISSNKFKSDVQYYFPNTNDFKYIKNLNDDILSNIFSYCININDVEKEYLQI